MKSNILYWVWHISGGILIILVVVAVAGANYQQQTSQQDHEQYKPFGEMMVVGNHKLHLYCPGLGSPTFILESGFINTYMSWTKVQPKVANFTRVCSYDRAAGALATDANTPIHLTVLQVIGNTVVILP